MAVFCGSREGSDPLFTLHARELGELLAAHRIRMIYGGGRKGLMGVVADAVMNNGGKVVGIIPELLVEWETQHLGLTELHVVNDMHTRKKMMYERCDAALVLPGGYGTLDELFELLTWNTLQIHSKKIIILNSAGFYDHLLRHIELLSMQGFLYESWKERIAVVAEPAAIFSGPDKIQFPS
ncbi:MAG TPA: TIGR00730 family Rossman fold protein [Chitinophagaceae bacterium]